MSEAQHRVGINLTGTQTSGGEHSMPPPLVFISYAHSDEKHKEQMVKQLSVLRAENLIDDWNDRKLEPGCDWDKEIRQRIYSARIVLLLVSVDFLSSGYIQGVEMKIARDRHRSGAALIVPVILESCYWKRTWLKDLLALPKDGRPVLERSYRARGWLEVIQSFDGLLSGLRGRGDPARWRDVETGFRDVAESMRPSDLRRNKGHKRPTPNSD